MPAYHIMHIAVVGQAIECTERNPKFIKGFVRRAAAEFELVKAQAAWDKRIAEDAKWAEERKERNASP